MEIGNEIGQKIRSAIKAKLVDLGAYVDDELPDYVMVMVANKKSEAQMCEDLSLFLGANTSKFTAWLHGLLQKLLSITSEPSSAPKQSAAKNASATVPAQASLAVVGGSADAKTANEPTVPSFSAAEAPVTKATKSKAVPMKKRDVGVKQPEAVIDDEPVIRLSLEHDEFEEESRGISDTMKDVGGMGDTEAARVKIDSVKKMAKESIIDKAMKGAADLTEEYVPEPVKSAARNLQKQSSKDATEQPRKMTCPVSLGVRGESRKRPHGLESSVGAVVKHDVDEKYDAYDPYRPAIGNVASVVKVTERKSSIPPSMQANKMLLFRAMKEAEQSVAQIKKTSAASESVKGASSRPIASIQSRLGTGKASKPSKTDSRVSKSPSVQKESRAVSVRPAKEIPSTSVSTKASLIERLGNDRKTESNFDEDEAETEGRDTALQANRVVSEAEEDTRKVQCSSSGTDTRKAQDKLKQEIEERKRKELNEDRSEELQLRRILMQQQWPIMERAASPKFVVTLDGICQNSRRNLQLEELEEEEELSVAMMEPVPRNVVHVKPQVVASQLVEEDIANDAEYESEFEPASKKARVTERCKFWPSCKNGDACLFHHPSVPCKMFPGCRFGEKCLYVHPNCKFDGVCRNPSCSYTHSTPHSTMPQPVPIIMPIRMPIYSFPAGPIFAPVSRRVSAPTLPKQMKCKFYPNCTDMNCAFAHPKPCRYGLSCTNKQTCPFSHPQLPTKKQMKWVSAPAQQENV